MTSKDPPSKIEATVDEIMHKIQQHTAKLQRQAKNGGSRKFRRALTAKRTKMAMTCFDLEDSTDD